MKRMKPTFNFFFFITAVSALMAASCDKNNHDVPKGELPDPIRIELRAAEQEMIGADQAFAFEFFENVYSGGGEGRRRQLHGIPAELEHGIGDDQQRRHG